MTTAFDPAPTRLDDVLDPAWLSAMLSVRWPGTAVSKVAVVETLITQATKVRIVLDFASAEPEVSRNLCIKGVLMPTGAPSTASVVETRFYREMASSFPVRVPPCVHAELNQAGTNGVVVMQDLIVAGAEFCGALAPFTPDEARKSLDQLARLHATAWQGSVIFETKWIPRFLDQIGSAPIMPLARLQALLDGAKGEHLPGSVKDAARLQCALQALAGQVLEQPGCLVHGDAHAGNLYRHGDEVGLVDWQILQKGEWAQDVAYHIATVLTPEDRAAHERALLDHYREKLKSLGGPPLAPEPAWERYRAALVYGYYLWAITQKVEPAITNEFTRRLGLAVADHRSLELLGA